MVRRERSTMLIRSDDRGWVLVNAMMFLLVIQAVAMVTIALVRYSIMTSSAYRGILQQSDEAAMGTGRYSHTMLCAPEGWDHAYFLAEITEKVSGDAVQVQNLSMHTSLQDQPYERLEKVNLSAIRPHIIFLIDDSESMTWSSGLPYAEDAIYVKRPNGEVRATSYALGETDFVETEEGIYFRGRYGNEHMQAAYSEYFGGAMPCSTFYYPLAQALLDELALGEIALATTSRGLIQPFSQERALLLSALATIHPEADTGPLSEALYKTMAAFPEACVTDRHIILISDGLALNDGNLPRALQDFDHDGNPGDTYVPGIGSHCLDDVSAYAASLGIKVHTIGPDRTFLRETAEKGTGHYMPGPDAFVGEDPFISQIPVRYAGEELLLINRYARFDPPWLKKDGATYYALDEENRLVLKTPYSVSGPVTGTWVDGETLYCTTTKDYLLAIDIPSKALSWVIRGPGGKVLCRQKMILAGPNRNGLIFCMRPVPEILWSAAGERMDASLSQVYIAKGNAITARDLKSGTIFSAYSGTEASSAIRYDPCRGLLYTGTDSGLLSIFSPDLIREGLIVTNYTEKIVAIHAFHMRKKLYLIVLTEKHLLGATTDGPLWSKPVETGISLQAVVMDARVYLATWEEKGPCGGIDTGQTTLIVYDALTGENLSSKVMIPGRALGPLIDLKKGEIAYANSAMISARENIADLSGVKTCPLGTRFVR